jgi:hypothetical protein
MYPVLLMLLLCLFYVLKQSYFMACMFTKYTLMFLVFNIFCQVSWLRHCATSRKITGSIPNGVTGIFD